eukprot:646459-Prorocentrum_minimum.AAC.1
MGGGDRVARGRHHLAGSRTCGCGLAAVGLSAGGPWGVQSGVYDGLPGLENKGVLAPVQVRGGVCQLEAN